MTSDGHDRFDPFDQEDEMADAPAPGGDTASPQTPGMPYVPTTTEILANSTAACAEITRQIGHQSTDASSIDTKTTGLLTILAGTLTLAVAHLHLDTQDRAFSATVTAFVGALMLLLLIQTLRPRDGFSYGADPSSLVALLDGYATYGVVLRMAQSLAAARDKNVLFLGVKQSWFNRTTVGLVFLALGLAWMIHTGAIG